MLRTPSPLELTGALHAATLRVDAIEHLCDVGNWGGCATDATAPQHASLIPLSAMLTQLPCDTSGSLSGFTTFWPCSAIVHVGGDTALQATTGAAMGVWNSALAHPLLPGVPKLSWTTGTPDVLVIKADSGALTDEIWCGGTTNPPSQITFTTNCANHAATFHATLVHEMSHVLGFTSTQYEKVSSPLNCAINLADSNQVNSSVCQHEIEFIYAAYGYLSINTETFWGKSIVTGFVGLPTTMSIVEGDSQAVTATALKLGRQITPTAPLGGTQVGWISDDPMIANPTVSVGTSTRVKAIGAGTTKIRATANSGIGSAYIRGAVITSAGQEIDVTVAAAPLGPFKVTSISGLTPPTTVEGSYPLTAPVVNQPEGTLKIRWQVTYSNDSLGPFDTGYGATGYTLSVPAGSYNIRVTATPRSYEGTQFVQGLPLIRDFPVCTGSGGGGDLAVSEPGGGTDAVGGC